LTKLVVLVLHFLVPLAKRRRENSKGGGGFFGTNSKTGGTSGGLSRVEHTLMGHEKKDLGGAAKHFLGEGLKKRPPVEVLGDYHQGKPGGTSFKALGHLGNNRKNTRGPSLTGGSKHCGEVKKLGHQKWKNVYHEGTVCGPLQ